MYAIKQDFPMHTKCHVAVCVDCGAPNPQWASLGVASFICLSCVSIGVLVSISRTFISLYLYRYARWGWFFYGALILGAISLRPMFAVSFVRSCTMDTWSADQLNRMHVCQRHNLFCGPAPTNLPPAYRPRPYRSAVTAPLKRSWRNTNRKKLVGIAKVCPYMINIIVGPLPNIGRCAKLAGQPWTPSLPPDSTSAMNSSGTLRKSRAGTRGGLSVGTSRDASASPAASGAPTPVDRKVANEAYFASLGETNASRPDDLPPSQGGRYVGFGSTPSPQPGSSNPNFGLSSAAAPSLADLQTDPAAALSKGWGFLSTLVTSAARVANESVVQPGLERARDPALRAVVEQYAARASELGRGANDWGRRELGVDVVNTASSAWSNLKGGPGGPGGQGEYGRVAEGSNEDSWNSWHDDDGRSNQVSTGTNAQPGTTNKASEWDEWDDKGWATTGVAEANDIKPSVSTKSDTSKTQTPAKKDDEWEDW
ncbi:ArfGap domain-containing protein [Rhizoctonia solani AG-1 IA]|uniref:ArfGap domain-containing protein n=1 Tax=Thanatephorus cucumeris (strain AG1-IA) TaxID=983506 RepID=L8XAC3_THACA|nr:ArfGap domain-containing protein [Rhizoctonia solani AG-1 IA]